jgi:hypothetical protein
METLRKSMSLNLNKLATSLGQGRLEKWHIENEGITRDVSENKRPENVQPPLPRDVDEE